MLIAAIVNIILNYFFIPKFGGVAAAYTSVVSYIILFFLARKLVQGLNRDLFSDKNFMVFFLSVVCGCLIFEMVYARIVLRYIVFIGMLVLSLIYMWVKREEILIIVKGKP